MRDFGLWEIIEGCRREWLGEWGNWVIDSGFIDILSFLFYLLMYVCLYLFFYFAEPFEMKLSTYDTLYIHASP